MGAAIGLAVLAVVMAGGVPVALDTAPATRWAARSPRAAVALWQAVGVSAALAATGAGLALAVAPLHRGLVAGLVRLAGATRHPNSQVNGLAEAVGLTLAATVVAVLAAGFALTAVRTVVTRRRHRILLDLVGGRDPGLPGALVLHDERAAAFCVPGLRPRVVVSRGTVGILSPAQIGAVIAHERGHLRGRHDLVMLPFTSLVEMLQWIPYAAHAPQAVAGLLEMAADDHAARRADRRALAGALVSLAEQRGAPSCAFAAAEGLMTARVRRLVEPVRPAPLLAALATAAATVAVAAPLAVLGWAG